MCCDLRSLASRESVWPERDPADSERTNLSPSVSPGILRGLLRVLGAGYEFSSSEKVATATYTYNTVPHLYVTYIVVHI